MQKSAQIDLIGQLTFLGLLLLSVASLAWFFPQREWVYDDRALLQDHAAVKTGNFRRIWSEPYWAELIPSRDPEFLHRPVFLSVLSILRSNPLLLRSLVWISHFLAAGMLWFFLKGPSGNRALGVPFFAMAVFVHHPVNVEVTAQAIGLMETVPTLLATAAFYTTQSHPLFSVLCIASVPGWKETGYFWLLAYLIYLIRLRKFRTALGVSCIGIGWLATRIFALGGIVSANTRVYALLNPLVELDIADAFLTRVALLGHYLRLFLFPTLLVSDYSRGTLPLPAYVLQIWFLLGAGFLAVAFANRRFFARRSNMVLVAAGLSLLPALHLLQPLKVIFAERFAYGFTWGLCLLLGVVLQGLLSRSPTARKKIFSAVACSVLVLFYARTAMRHRDWRDRDTLFTQDAVNFPRNAKLHFNRGMVFGSQSRWENAKEAFLQTLDLASDFPEAHRRLGIVYQKLNQPEKANQHFQRAFFLEGR